MAPDSAPAAGERFKFKYVFIPCDTTEPIQERELEAPRGGDAEVSSLLDALKRHFRAASPGKTDAQKRAQKAALLEKLQQAPPAGGGGGDAAAAAPAAAAAAAAADADATATATAPSSAISPEVRDLLDRVVDGDLLGGGMVENIALLSNAPETGFVAVNLYCDDEAALKALPSNARASSLAMQCGKPLDVRGDAFLARVFDNEEDFRRMDLALSEVSSGAGWVRKAARQADRRRDRERAGAAGADPSAFLAGLRRGGAAGAAEVASKPKAAHVQAAAEAPSDAERDKGNARAKAGDWEGAAGHYTSALKLAGVLGAAGAAGAAGGQATDTERRRLRAAALGNRAVAFLKLERWEDAAADATAVIDEAGVEGEVEEGGKGAAAGGGGSKTGAGAAAAPAAAVAKARLRRATARRAMGDPAGAKADLEAVLEAEPSNKEAAEALKALKAQG